MRFILFVKKYSTEIIWEEAFVQTKFLTYKFNVTFSLFSPVCKGVHFILLQTTGA